MRSQKHIKDSEHKYVNIVNERGDFAQRIAGSGCGKYGVCDCISVEKGQTFAVEIKSTQAEILRLSKIEVIRLIELKDIALKHKIYAKLVIHFKRRGWQEIDITNSIIKNKYQCEVNK